MPCEAAVGRVSAAAYDRGPREQPTEIVEVVAILAGGDIHPRGGALAHQRKAGKIIRADRLLEPPKSAKPEPNRLK
jgi:hypothetical protein